MNSQERQQLTKLEKRFYLYSKWSNCYWDGSFRYVPDKKNAIQLKGPHIQKMLEILNSYCQNYSAVPVDE